MSADMSGSGKSSSNEDKQKYAMADTNIVNERSGGTAGDMSTTGKSSSTGDAYSLGDANIANQQGGGTVGRGSSASDAASLEPGMRPEKSMADKMRERDGGSGSAPDARSRITGDLMSGDDSEMMGRDEETLEKRHQAAGPGGGSATDQGSIPMDFKGDEARQQQSEMSAEM